jgi:hypothetical protein
MGKGSKNKEIVAVSETDAAAGVGAARAGAAGAAAAAKADTKATPKSATNVKTPVKAAPKAVAAADAKTTTKAVAKTVAPAEATLAAKAASKTIDATDDVPTDDAATAKTAAVSAKPVPVEAIKKAISKVVTAIAKAIAAAKAVITSKVTEKTTTQTAPKRAARTTTATRAKRNKSLADDDALSRADEMFKKRRDLRDGLIALTVLIAIIAAPAVGAAVQAHEQSGNVAAVEDEPSGFVQVAEKEAAFVPLVVNAVKTGDTALTGAGNPGFIVRVLFTGQEDPSEATVSKNGTWTLVAPSGVSLKAGDEKVLDITQNDPKTSDSYRPGAITPTKPETKPNPVVTEEPEPTTETPEESDPEPVWHDEPWSEQVLVRAAWTERIPHPAEYTTMHHEATEEVDPNTGELVFVPAYDTQELVREAWTEEIYHPAEYRTDYYDGYWE